MRKVIVFVIGIFVASCASYSLVNPGAVAVGDFDVSPTQSWNQASGKVFGRQLWTQDGQLLNTIIFFDGIQDGQPLFKITKKAEHGIFKSTMLPNEIAELTESSMAKVMNTSATKVSDLKPVDFLNGRGFEFTLSYVNSSDVPMKSLARAAVRNNKLYMILYNAAEMHYYDRSIQEVEAIMASAKAKG